MKNNFKFLKKFIINTIFLFFSLIARILNFLKFFFGILSSKFVFVLKGNTFYKDFDTDLNLTNKIKFKEIEAKVKINGFWDYWRIYDFENYPVKYLYENKEKYKSKKIIFYEIGANVGYSSLLISKILKDIGKVYSFEIETANFKTLSDNIILNRLNNIIPLNIGISSKNSISKFYYNKKFLKKNSGLPFSSMGSHSITFDKNVHDENIFSLSTFMKYEDIIKIFSLEKPTHLYIDAFGAELLIIESIKMSGKDYFPDVVMIDIEEGEKEMNNSSIYKLLISMGYELKSFDVVNRPGWYVPLTHHSIFEKKTG